MNQFNDVYDASVTKIYIFDLSKLYEYLVIEHKILFHILHTMSNHCAKYEHPPSTNERRVRVTYES